MAAQSNRRPEAGRNVGKRERWVSGLAGAALLAYAWRRRRRRRRHTVLVPLGIGLVRRAVTGRCEVNALLGRNSAREEGQAGVSPRPPAPDDTRISREVTVDRPLGEVFRFWQRFDNLPRFMDTLESVTALDARRARWIAKGRLGTRIAWDTETHTEIPNELIAWRALEGGEIEQSGSVRFSAAPGGSTLVRLYLRYAAPPGKPKDVVAHILGNDPERRIAEDLRRFKQVMESGDVSLPTTSPG